MTALPEPPACLLTVAEYALLGESTTGYTELRECHLVTWNLFPPISPE
ncbi:MAG: hypothetical protein ACRDRX_00465 [Pseudonocardiaceae bacterium]